MNLYLKPVKSSYFNHKRHLKDCYFTFSRIFGLSRSRFDQRLDFLMKFLDLPSKKRMLQNMSGGQQRRASLAVALLHEPELLILDEPTVNIKRISEIKLAKNFWFTTQTNTKYLWRFFLDSLTIHSLWYVCKICKMTHLKICMVCSNCSTICCNWHSIIAVAMGRRLEFYCILQMFYSQKNAVKNMENKFPLKLEGANLDRNF